jgi:hypothetical protein
MNKFVHSIVLALSALVTACGGGEPVAAPAPLPNPPPVAPVVHTAHARQKVIVTVGEASTTGMEEVALQRLMNCNGMRTSIYKLPAQAIAEAQMALTRFAIEERWFDRNRSAKYSTQIDLQLPDYERFMAELPTLGDTAAAPDCSLVRIVEVRSAKLLMDGVAWELNFSRKEARGVANTKAFVKVPSRYTEAELAGFTRIKFFGDESCYQLPAGPGDGGLTPKGQNCIWDHFARDDYLDMPWVTQGDATALGLRLRVQTLDAWVNRDVPASVFQIPADFTRRGPN